jgi:hypothetical protein
MMSQSSSTWWTICRRNSTDDPADGLCPVCQHPSLNHPGAHNPGLKACVICALDQLDLHTGDISLRLLGRMTAAELDELDGIGEDA